MSTTDRDELAAISAVAYGKRHRLRLMMLILDMGSAPICQKDVVEVADVSPATVKQLFDELAALNLLRQLPDEGLRKKYFDRVDGPGWLWARSLAGELWSGVGSPELRLW